MDGSWRASFWVVGQSGIAVLSAALTAATPHTLCQHGLRQEALSPHTLAREGPAKSAEPIIWPSAFASFGAMPKEEQKRYKTLKNKQKKNHIKK